MQIDDTPDAPHSSPALNRALMEAVEFVHAEGWDADHPTLFALVPSEFVSASLVDPTTDVGDAPLALVVQDDLPTNLPAGSPELADYLARASWPAAVSGVALVQEIKFRDVSSGPDSAPRPARLISGVLRDGAQQTLLQLRPTEEELAASGLFAEDEIQLRGGHQVAPGVIAALRAGLSGGDSDDHDGDDDWG